MPASWSASPAGCILGLSFFEPMMIPTRGAATSISSKASSTAGISVGAAGVGAGVSPGIGSSEISLTWCPLWLSGHALGSARGDVGADLHSLEGDPAGGTVSTLALGRPRVGQLGERRRLGEPLDHVALRGGGGIAGRGEDERHGPVLGELGP